MTHNLSVKEYQAQYGIIKDSMSKVTWHKCQLCSEDILLDGDVIHRHANVKHRMSMKEFTSRFIISAAPKPNHPDMKIEIKEEALEAPEQQPESGDGFMNE